MGTNSSPLHPLLAIPQNRKFFRSSSFFNQTCALSFQSFTKIVGHINQLHQLHLRLPTTSTLSLTVTPTTSQRCPSSLLVALRGTQMRTRFVRSSRNSAQSRRLSS